MFPLHVLAADQPFYEGDCESLVVPTLDGQYGVLAGHCDIILAIVPGTLTYRTPDGTEHAAAVAAGIMKVEEGEVLVLVDSAVRPEDIDEMRPRRAGQRGALAEEEHRRASCRSGTARPCACAAQCQEQVFKRLKSGIS